jgi:glycerol-3-phosphate acyltransferase PlsY
MIVMGLLLVGSYLIGSIPFGYLVARMRGVDIFREGSGNIGATNVGRVLGRRFGILVFLLDFGKGAVPTLIAGLMAGQDELGFPKHLVEVLAGLAAFLGHLFPVYLRFRGGKGVATAAGVVAVLLPGPTLGALLAWIAVVSATRYVSLASLVAAAVLCTLRLVTTPEPFARDNITLTAFCFVAAGLVAWRHRANIGRLLRGTENRLRDTPAMLQLSKIVHLLALGLWFGSTVFFSLVAAPVIFDSFGSLATKPAPERPAWLPATLDKDQANELAGLAVGPIFRWYFVLQGVCGLLALATSASWSWSQPSQTIDKLRFVVLALALTTVLIGWPLAQKVSALRSARYDSNPAVAAVAKADFPKWHVYSLLLNLGTTGLVTVALVLAAWLPGAPRPADDTVIPAQTGTKAENAPVT